MTFSVNCTWRDEPDSPVGNRVCRITPNVVLPGVATRPGFPKFAWLKISKISARNCVRIASRILVFLRTEKSTLWNAGPVMEFRPRLPKCKTRAPLRKLTGIANVEPVGQFAGSVGSHTELLNHCLTSRIIWIGAITSVRMVALPVRLLMFVVEVLPERIFSGLPD